MKKKNTQNCPDSRLLRAFCWSIVVWNLVLISCTPVYPGLREGNLQTLQKTIEGGADINGTLGSNQLTPLMYAALHGHADIAAWLIEKGASVNATGGDGVTALELAIERRTPAQMALIKMLLDAGADPNTFDDHLRTPFRRAVDSKNEQIVQLLLQYGAITDVEDEVGEYPLTMAAKRNAIEVAKLLLGAGANPNVTDIRGFTPLMTAVLQNNEPLVQILLYFGADPNQTLRDGRGPSALDFAMRRPNSTIAALLQQIPAMNQARLVGNRQSIQPPAISPKVESSSEIPEGDISQASKQEEISPNEPAEKMMIVGFSVPPDLPIELFDARDFVQYEIAQNAKYQVVQGTLTVESGPSGSNSPASTSADSPLKTANENADVAMSTEDPTTGDIKEADATSSSTGTIEPIQEAGIIGNTESNNIPAIEPKPPCSGDACIWEAAEAAGADKILFGRLIQKGGRGIVDIELKLFNVETKESIGEHHATLMAVTTSKLKATLSSGIRQFLWDARPEMLPRPELKAVASLDNNLNNMGFRRSEAIKRRKLRSKGSLFFRLSIHGGGGGFHGNGSALNEDGAIVVAPAPRYAAVSTGTGYEYVAATNDTTPLGGLRLSLGGNLTKQLALSADYQVSFGAHDIGSAGSGFLSHMILGPGLTVYSSSKVIFFFSGSLGWANLMAVHSSSSSEEDAHFTEKANGVGLSAGFGFEFRKKRHLAIGFSLVRVVYSATFGGVDAVYNNWNLLSSLNITRN